MTGIITLIIEPVKVVRKTAERITSRRRLGDASGPDSTARLCRSMFTLLEGSVYRKFRLAAPGSSIPFRHPKSLLAHARRARVRGASRWDRLHLRGRRSHSSRWALRLDRPGGGGRHLRSGDRLRGSAARRWRLAVHATRGA